MKYLLMIFCLLVTVMPAQAAPSQQNWLAASIEVLTPGVELKPGGTERWLPITGSAVVAAGDMIRTDETGSALVVWFNDGTMMELAPDTELLIDDFSGTEEGSYNIATTLTRGRVLHTVERLLDTQSTYTINSPGVSSAVRGTSFAIDVDAETLIVVREGRVEALIEGRADTVLVDSGLALEVVPPAGSAELENIAQSDNPLVQQLDQSLAQFELMQADTDGDGIIDLVDQCPNEPGHLFYRGCPGEIPREFGSLPGLSAASSPTPTPTATPVSIPATRAPAPTATAVPVIDTDGDGVPDGNDRCPNESGPAGNEGCPIPPDADGDGVPDSNDVCPTVPGPANNDGCPMQTAASPTP